MPTLTSPDPVLESQLLWQRYKKWVLTGLILAVLTVAAWGAYRFSIDSRDAKGAQALATAKTAADFREVIAQHKDTPAGQSAYLFLAEEQVKKKEFEQANVTLQTFIDKNPNHPLKGTARMGIAANLESLGKMDEALAAFQRLAADDPQGYTAPLALVSQVHILKEKKQIDEARRVCETVMSQYRESLVASEASRQLGLLKPNKPPGKMLQLKPQSLTPNGTKGAAPVKVSVPPAAAPAGPPAAVPPANSEPKKP